MTVAVAISTKQHFLVVSDSANLEETVVSKMLLQLLATNHKHGAKTDKQLTHDPLRYTHSHHHQRWDMLTPRTKFKLYSLYPYRPGLTAQDRAASLSGNHTVDNRFDGRICREFLRHQPTGGTQGVVLVRKCRCRIFCARHYHFHRTTHWLTEMGSSRGVEFDARSYTVFWVLSS